MKPQYKHTAIASLIEEGKYRGKMNYEMARALLSGVLSDEVMKYAERVKREYEEMYKK